MRNVGFMYSCKLHCHSFVTDDYRPFALIARFPTIPNQFWEFCLLATCRDL